MVRRVLEVAVYTFNPVLDARWAAFLQEHPRASVFHSAPWLESLSRTYGYEPLAFTTSAPSTELTNAVVFCRIRSWLTGRRLVSLPFSDHCEPLVDRSDELDEMIPHLKKHVDEGKCKYIEIRPVSCELDRQKDLNISAAYSFHRLNLRPNAQELFRNFHKNCVQRKIGRAEREKLTYDGGNSEALLKEFYRLLVMSRRRQSLPPQPIGWFRRLIAAFGKDLTIRVASKDGVAVASILTLSHKKTIVYKYGCSDPAANKFGGMALLFWRTIQEAQQNGLEELDMGRSDADNPGLVAFKDHWGAIGTSIKYWRYCAKPGEPQKKWKKMLARQVISTAPDSVLETIGKLLYRHVG